MIRVGVPVLINTIIERAKILHRQLLGRVKTDIPEYGVGLCHNRTAEKRRRKRLLAGDFNAGHIEVGDFGMIAVCGYAIVNRVVEPVRNGPAQIVMKMKGQCIGRDLLEILPVVDQFLHSRHVETVILMTHCGLNDK